METERPIPESTKKFQRWLLNKMEGDLKPYGFGSLTGSLAIGGATDKSDIDLLYVAKDEKATQAALSALLNMGFEGTKNYDLEKLDWEHPASGVVFGHRFLPVHVIVKHTIGAYNAHVLATREMRERVKENPYLPKAMKALKGTSPQDYYKHWDLLINKRYGLLTADQKINPIE